MNDETERITRVYAERERRLGPDFYSLLRPGNMYRDQRVQRGVMEALRGLGLKHLRDLTVLDVGCGTGDFMRTLVRLGLPPAQVLGVDVQAERLGVARDLSPHLRYELIDGTTLPFPDGSFDMLVQMTVFSSILDMDVQRSLAAEMRRVLRPGGFVLWYDMRVTDPRNRDLVPMTRERIAALFPDSELSLRAHTLLPGLSRRLAPVSWLLCELLEAFPVLRGHYLGVIRPHGAPAS